MRILEYVGLDTSRVTAQYQKLVDALGRDDFRAAEVKKLVNVSHGKLYRAKLDYANRLLFCLVRHETEMCALMLEVIENHDYGHSRFLRGGRGGAAGALPASAAHGHSRARQADIL